MGWRWREERRRVVKILETGIDYGTFGNIWAASLSFGILISSTTCDTSIVRDTFVRTTVRDIGIRKGWRENECWSLDRELDLEVCRV